MSRNLAARIAVAAVAIPVILWICYRGGWWLFAMVALFALVAMLEFLFAERYRPDSLFFWIGLAAPTVVFLQMGRGLAGSGVIFDLPVRAFFTSLPLAILGLFIIGGMLFALGKEPPAELLRRHMRLMWGAVYISALYPFVFLLGQATGSAGLFSGGDILLLVFGVLWVGDTAAMGVGSALGRHKLAPTVSPNKTVEGFVGGLVGAAAVGVVMVFWRFSAVAWYHVMIIAVGCSVFGQLGDLVESMWKRSLGIKDSSAIIPGHGGVLDRFDSLLFAAPFAYFYIVSFLR